ncbi:amino acid synthesis family protein [Mesorhizobium sp. B1-1-6]|nr:amino acid synthesis family protein [Mesorhizobium sp. B1-1-6]
MPLQDICRHTCRTARGCNPVGFLFHLTLLRRRPFPSVDNSAATRAAACAVVQNPLAGKAAEDLLELVSYGAEPGELLVREAAMLLSKPVVSYGKAAIVGPGGDIEHAAATLRNALRSSRPPLPCFHPPRRSNAMDALNVDSA